MKSRLAIAMSVLMLGTVLAALPSFAQTRDRTTGTAAPEQSSACVHFQQGCSDKPYPMAQNAAPNSAQTGARESREARSASGGERVSGERTSGNRERLSSARTRGSARVSERERVGASARVSERERVGGSARVSERERVGGSARVSERAATSDQFMRSAAPEPSGVDERVAVREGARGESFGFGERRDYYNAAPGVEVAGAGRDAIAMCEARFQSFDPETGTYMGFDGIRHPCP